MLVGDLGMFNTLINLGISINDSRYIKVTGRHSYDCFSYVLAWNDGFLIAII